MDFATPLWNFTHDKGIICIKSKLFSLLWFFYVIADKNNGAQFFENPTNTYPRILNANRGLNFARQKGLNNLILR